MVDFKLPSSPDNFSFYIIFKNREFVTALWRWLKIPHHRYLLLSVGRQSITGNDPINTKQLREIRKKNGDDFFRCKCGLTFRNSNEAISPIGGPSPLDIKIILNFWRIFKSQHSFKSSWIENKARKISPISHQEMRHISSFLIDADNQSEQIVLIKSEQKLWSIVYKQELLQNFLLLFTLSFRLKIGKIDQVILVKDARDDDNVNSSWFFLRNV